ncbi:NAD(P)/FAD-dependent oxidoreductase [Pseudomonas sp. N40(2020)]|uniref:NAD(P)/FAD-dependent oxidoreductase n=1 Tax=Pseudomonas sp. N40(2020) TaxID=2767798 RepID=UPI001656B664|nr:NAD(P)/FAD-dependent oxidoreductase [Pseudomonas sp. N40(2020)]MBC8999567.1 NAD(P)/FAD-dependent oxidoreductase [Pseudomonas sp. N40(2020)]
MVYEVIIVGGSYAGLSAGLQLARARRKVLVLDSGLRRNRFAETSHGFLGQDGRAPGDIAQDARKQLLAYPSVQWLADTALEARQTDQGFQVRTTTGQQASARRLIIASGVIDELPAIEGLQERWGKSVFHCPYCHGYELNQGAIGVLATSPLSIHHALLLPDWGQTTFFTNGVFEPDAEQLAELDRRGVTLESQTVSHISGKRADVVLSDGRVISVAGLFAMPRTRMASPLAEQLGCVFEDGPMGPFIQTDAMQQTSIPGVFACGDAALAAGSVAVSVGDGARAGAGTHRSLVFV